MEISLQKTPNFLLRCWWIYTSLLLWSLYNTLKVQVAKQTGEHFFWFVPVCYKMQVAQQSAHLFEKLSSSGELMSCSVKGVRIINRDMILDLLKKNFKTKLSSLLFCSHMSYEENIIRKKLLFVSVGKYAKLHTGLQNKCKMKGFLYSRLFNRFYLLFRGNKIKYT